MSRRKRKRQLGQTNPTNLHHRLPVSRNGTNCFPFNNLIRVSSSKHRAFHILFANMTANEIVNYLNDTWIDPRYRMELILIEEEDIAMQKL